MSATPQQIPVLVRLCGPLGCGSCEFLQGQVHQAVSVSARVRHLNVSPAHPSHKRAVQAALAAWSSRVHTGGNLLCKVWQPSSLEEKHGKIYWGNWANNSSPSHHPVRWYTYPQNQHVNCTYVSSYGTDERYPLPKVPQHIYIYVCIFIYTYTYIYIYF